MTSFFLTPQAIQDLNEIHDFIAEDSLSMALRFINTLQEKCHLLAQSPAIGRSREELAPSLRSFPVGKHVIFYRDAQDGIEIIRILHGARDIPPLFETDT